MVHYYHVGGLLLLSIFNVKRFKIISKLRTLLKHNIWCNRLVALGGESYRNRRGCSSEILNLTPKGDHLGVAQAFCDL